MSVFRFFRPIAIFPALVLAREEASMKAALIIAIVTAVIVSAAPDAAAFQTFDPFDNPYLDNPYLNNPYLDSPAYNIGPDPWSANRQRIVTDCQTNQYSLPPTRTCVHRMNGTVVGKTICRTNMVTRSEDCRTYR
jgi:hypothetical protein